MSVVFCWKRVHEERIERVRKWKMKFSLQTQESKATPDEKSVDQACTPVDIAFVATEKGIVNLF